jgi:hypothetical protein
MRVRPKIQPTQSQDVADRIAAYMTRMLAEDAALPGVPAIPGNLPETSDEAAASEGKQAASEEKQLAQNPPSQNSSGGLPTLFGNSTFTPAARSKPPVVF